MAQKKTSKKKSSKLGLILTIVVIALAVLAFCMAFLTTVKFNYEILWNEVEATFTGFQAMFGYEVTESIGLVEYTASYLGFICLALLAFVLPLVGVVLTLLKNKIARIVGLCLMVVGGVLIFFVPSFAALATVEGKLTAEALVLEGATRVLGVGAILGGIFSLLGAGVAGYSIFKK